MISVIIPTYNRSKTIERSVASVLNQTIKDIELIVVDDCSTDNTKELLDSFKDKRLKYIRLVQNSGACVARNIGIDNATGEYIAFQDSDDEWESDKLDIQLNALKNSGCDICFCGKKRISIDGSKSDTTQTDLKEGIVPYSVLYKQSRVSTQTIVAKSEVFQKVRFDENVKKAQDYDWALRAGMLYSFFFVSVPLVTQYFQNDSLTVKGKDHLIEVEMCEYFYNKYIPYYDNNKGLQIALLNRLANYLTLANNDASYEYFQLFSLSHELKFLLLCVLSKARILSTVKHLKRKNDIL